MGLRIAAALAWYDEPVEFLSRMVSSLVGNVDELVAFDGRWHGMPGDSDVSALEQAVELEERGSELGLKVTVIRNAGRTAPTTPGAICWDSQVAKRDALMTEAGDCADWILVIDGDEFLQVRGDLHTKLTDVQAAAAAVTIISMNRPWPLRDLAPMSCRSPRLFHAGTRVSGRHNGYLFDGVPADLNQIDLSNEVTIWHDNQARPPERRAAAQTYRRTRRIEGLELAAA